ncbi:hypothetical protein [Clostridium sp. BNL1100]|uniref:hypothetical protein n=1 Tax=Clostridium sp. BNL1100 TaxID=755731 RepID=UPI00024A7E06|nr:hypothetical protein [Clostridium sp. BNL1100]AEY66244.1 hypothetical protein Clo1100_2053 [Clostridium sp. BNL1100]
MKINLKRNNDKVTQTDKTSSLEKILFRTCIIFFIVLISVQIVLSVPSVRVRLNIMDKSVGIPLGSDEYLYGRGKVTLELIDEEPDPQAKILVNGEQVAVFDKIEIPINVNDGDVIEIDGSESQISHIIKVQNASSNINNKCINAIANIERNIKKLVKIQFN